MTAPRQLTLDFGVTPQESCLMCRLSAECRLGRPCCQRCAEPCNVRQRCSLPFAESESQRLRTWVYLTLPGQPLAPLLADCLDPAQRALLRRHQQRMFPKQAK